MLIIKNIIKFFFPNIQMYPFIISSLVKFYCDYYKFIRSIKSNSNDKNNIKLEPHIYDYRFNSGFLQKHYFQQDLWVARKVFESNTNIHYDIGSRLDGFVGNISVFCKVFEFDLRTQNKNINNINFIQSDITNLPVKENTIKSLSCLHVVEHIGLGRYKDTINPHGSIEAIKDIIRILSVNGNLYISVPVGRECICFNAHRIFSPITIMKYFTNLNLISYSLIDDNDYLFENIEPKLINDINYGCGLFHFKK